MFSKEVKLQCYFSVTGAIFGDIGVILGCLFVAGALFGAVAMLLFMAGAICLKICVILSGLFIADAIFDEF